MRYKYLACAAQSADITKLARACNTMTEAFTLEPCVKLHSAQLYVFFFLIDTEAQHPQHVNSLLAIGRSALRCVVTSSCICQAVANAVLCQQVESNIVRGRQTVGQLQ